MNKTVCALLWGLLGTFLFTLVFASGKITGGEISPFQIMFIRYISGFSLLVLIALSGNKPIHYYSSQRPGFHVCRSLCGTMGAVSFIHASQISPIAQVSALGLTDGLLTVILSIIFLGERVNVNQWLGALLCGFGAFVVVYDSNQSSFSMNFEFGLWLALIGALLIAIESVLIKLLTATENIMTILLQVNFFSMLILSLPALYSWSTPNIEQLLFYLALGPIAITAQYCWVKAYSLEDASVVTPINYSWMVFAALLGYLFFNESLGVYTLIGSVLIAIGGVMLARHSRQKHRLIKGQT